VIRCVAAAAAASIPPCQAPWLQQQAEACRIPAVTVDVFCVNFNHPLARSLAAAACSVQARVLRHITTPSSSADNQQHHQRKSVFDDMDPCPSTSFSELAPPSACSTFSEDPTAVPVTDSEQQTTADREEAVNGTWMSSSLTDDAATTTVTVDSKDLAFVLTESSDALATDSGGLSTQNDENNSKEVINSEAPTTVANTEEDHVTDVDAKWQFIDNDDEVRKTRTFRIISFSCTCYSSTGL